MPLSAVVPSLFTNRRRLLSEERRNNALTTASGNQTTTSSSVMRGHEKQSERRSFRQKLAVKEGDFMQKKDNLTVILMVDYLFNKSQTLA